MFYHLTYTVDKKFHRENFWKRYKTGKYHSVVDEVTNIERFHKFWWQVFDLEADTENIISDLNLTNMNVYPRYSFIHENSRLKNHIDIDRIVGINFNLMENHTPCLIMSGKRFDYESCLCDVGSVIHRVDFVTYPRLILKLAIREPWDKIVEAVSKSGFIDYEKTIIDNPDYASYVSKL